MKNMNFLQAIIPDENEQPERSVATKDRIMEVIDNVLPKEMKDILEGNINGLIEQTGGLETIGIDEAKVIVDIFDRNGIDPESMKNIVKQISLCEFSTREVIEVHRKYKIPVSELETDIFQVKGSGCRIMDSKGNWYLDLDSNYSASNLGMANPEITRGISNRASSLICMKEDRIQVARTGFLKEIDQMMPEGLEYFYWQNS